MHGYASLRRTRNTTLNISGCIYSNSKFHYKLCEFIIYAVVSPVAGIWVNIKIWQYLCPKCLIAIRLFGQNIFLLRFLKTALLMIFRYLIVTYNTYTILCTKEEFLVQNCCPRPKIPAYLKPKNMIRNPITYCILYMQNIWTFRKKNTYWIKTYM